MRSLQIAALCALLAGCASDTPEQHAARMAALGRAATIIGTGGVAPAAAPAPLPNILPPPPVNCTSWRDYMGTVHTTCR